MRARLNARNGKTFHSYAGKKEASIRFERRFFRDAGSSAFSLSFLSALLVTLKIRRMTSKRIVLESRGTYRLLLLLPCSESRYKK